jgi:hypothetical protein
MPTELEEVCPTILDLYHLADRITTVSGIPASWGKDT